jgi:hypothetical protein
MDTLATDPSLTLDQLFMFWCVGFWPFRGLTRLEFVHVVLCYT